MDIYHITPSLPRFASVAYTDMQAGISAIADLHGKQLNLDSPFGRDNRDDLGVWFNWSGRLTVVLAEPPRLVPTSVGADFPNLPDWALGIKDPKSEEAEKIEVDMQIKQERDSSPESTTRKRERQRSDRDLHRS